jgi:hypothetical protein
MAPRDLFLTDSSVTETSRPLSFRFLSSLHWVIIFISVCVSTLTPQAVYIWKHPFSIPAIRPAPISNYFRVWLFRSAPRRSNSNKLRIWALTQAGWGAQQPNIINGFNDQFVCILIQFRDAAGAGRLSALIKRDWIKKILISWKLSETKKL